MYLLRYCPMWESSSPSSPFCPVDGDVITPAEIFQDNCCKREISSLEVYCTNFPACTSVLTLNQLQEHLKLCQYEQLQCTNPGCEEVQQRRYLQKHLTNTCPHRREACPYCRQLFQLGIIQVPCSSSCVKRLIVLLDSQCFHLFPLALHVLK
ncbi:TNF receptor-associated factor 5-like isoform X2 [Leuresthes tenuis]|uniref:TNF receptor-associated factor 5-like isoform X2 n=1 Tax=Leuresthes tenuis TaxID=355514 RepID=UPI003B50277D